MTEWSYDWQILSPYLPMLWHGLALTAETSVLGFLLGMLIGLVGAAARTSPVWVLRFVAGSYVEIIRNTPSLVQIFMIYFGLPSLGIRLSGFEAGTIALGVSGGGYLIEILRSGFQAVPRGQREAAATLGLSRTTTYLRVVAPQALRIVYPPVVSQFIQMILGSSLLSIVALPELTGQAQEINAKTLLTMQIFGIALIAYLLLTNLVALLAGVVGHYVFKPPLRITRPESSGRRWVLGGLPRPERKRLARDEGRR